jgi:hypothetical protein
MLQPRIPNERRMPTRRNYLIDALILLGLATVAVVAWKMRPASDLALPPSPCNPSQGNCRVELPGGAHFELAVEPRPIPALEPFKVRISVHGMAPEKIEVDFSGVTMNMGYNRPELRQTLPGLFEGKASLPVCFTGTMEWRATVLLYAGNKTISVPFRFDAGRGA